MRTRHNILNNIMEELVDINIVEFDYAQDKKYVDAKYSNHQTVNAVIKKTAPLCIRDYENNIIRDEAYASIYEVMITKVAPDFTDNQLEQILKDIHTKKLDITNQFLVATYKLAIFKVKLIPCEPTLISVAVTKLFSPSMPAEYFSPLKRSISLRESLLSAPKKPTPFSDKFSNNSYFVSHVVSIEPKVSRC